MDALPLLVLAGAMGLLVMAHVALLTGLLLRPPRWRAALGLLVPPLAPFWGWEAGLKSWSVLWIASLLVYLVALAFSVT